MPQATFVQVGNQIDYTPDADVAAGAVVVNGPLVGVAERAISASVLGALTLRGLFDVCKAAVAINAGDEIYWDADGNPVGGVAGSGAATNVSTGNTFMGFAPYAEADTDETVRVVLQSEEATS